MLNTSLPIFPFRYSRYVFSVLGANISLIVNKVNYYS